MNFKNMSVKKSLLVGFGTTIIVSLLIIIISLVMMNVQKAQYGEIINQYVGASELSMNCRVTYNQAARNLRDAVLSGNMSSVDTANSKIDELTGTLAELKSLYPLEDKTELNNFESQVTTWMSVARGIGETARPKSFCHFLPDCELCV